VRVFAESKNELCSVQWLNGGSSHWDMLKIGSGYNITLNSTCFSFSGFVPKRKYPILSRSSHELLSGWYAIAGHCATTMLLAGKVNIFNAVLNFLIEDKLVQ